MKFKLSSATVRNGVIRKLNKVTEERKEHQRILNNMRKEFDEKLKKYYSKPKFIRLFLAKPKLPVVLMSIADYSINSLSDAERRLNRILDLLDEVNEVVLSDKELDYLDIEIGS